MNSFQKIAYTLSAAVIANFITTANAMEQFAPHSPEQGAGALDISRFDIKAERRAAIAERRAAARSISPVTLADTFAQNNLFQDSDSDNEDNAMDVEVSGTDADGAPAQ